MRLSAVDLNCDMGEGFGRWTIADADDASIMALISSANIATGFHAGDPMLMDETVRLAAQHGVGVGAHPGYRDLQGFGRRKISGSNEEILNDLIYQVGALREFARRHGVNLQHVKPHGALYNMAARDRGLSDAIARAVAAVDRRLILFGLPNSPMLDAARAAGLRVASEGFADRSYQPDGSLTPRSRSGAVIHDVDAVVARAVRMATEGVVLTADGDEVRLRVDTICVHGDTPGAAELVRRIRDGLRQASVSVGAAGAWL